MAQDADEQTGSIEVIPTKELFVSMLVKDISLVDAIIDLIDNSVDGARRLRPGGDYSGLLVKIDVDNEEFRIEDNCGGIEVEIARKQAFRFGRPPGTTPLIGSIGNFGIGMKRAVFKMGSVFSVESTTDTERFIVNVDVNKWLQLSPYNWNFEFSELETNLSPDPKRQRGTIITITSLDREVAKQFKRDLFIKKLTSEIAKAQQANIRKGLRIKVNNRPVGQIEMDILLSQLIAPAYIERNFEDRNCKPVEVKIYAGVGESTPSAAGWYVFCNNRLVLEADKSQITGWGWSDDDGRRIQRYHNQFSRFRGYVFFDSDDANCLPWNTSKTGIDEDSPIYITARQQMVILMRAVIDFLNNLDKEISQPEDKQKLTIALEDARPVKLEEVSRRETFLAPTREEAPPIPATLIRYSRPEEQVRRAKEKLNVSSPKEVGEMTFDYYYRLECSDDTELS